MRLGQKTDAGTFRQSVGRWPAVLTTPTIAEEYKWDNVKWPFLIVLLSTITFFFITQQEIFTTTVAVIAGITGALPVFIKLISLLTGKRVDEAERK